MEHFGRLPAAAAWRHETSREGFEVVFLAADEQGIHIAGEAALVMDDEPVSVGYALELDRDWITRRAGVRGRTRAGVRETRVEADGRGAWRVDGAAAPQLDGILDLDLEASAVTNALPVHRLRLEHGVATDAPAAWVRVHDLSTERLEQTYTRVGARSFDYAAPGLDFRVRLDYDDAGLVTTYPQIARRVR
jgi:hypothetical protein